MKSLLWFGILTLLSVHARAENFYSPLLCAVEDTSLRVQNSSSQSQAFWFQELGAKPFYEAYVSVKAHGQLTVALKDYLSTTASAVSLKTQNSTLSFKAFCKSTQKTWNIEGQHSPWKKLSLLNASPQFQIEFANLSQQNNPVEISFESFFGSQSSQSLVLPEGFARTSLKLSPPWGASSLKIRALGRWSGKAFDSSGQELLLEDETLIQGTPPPARYFLFQSQDPGTQDNFVVAMTNPKLIQESLVQIQNPQQARLLVARIEKSLQGFNRDLSSPTKAPWSWHVVEAQNYADFAHISCDGTPNLVEERLNSWLYETGGTICFWSYRVVRELRADELMRSPLLLRPGPGSLQHRRSRSSLYKL